MDLWPRRTNNPLGGYHSIKRYFRPSVDDTTAAPTQLRCSKPLTDWGVGAISTSAADLSLAERFPGIRRVSYQCGTSPNVSTRVRLDGSRSAKTLVRYAASCDPTSEHEVCE